MRGKKKRKNYKGRYVQLEDYMIDSKAWKQLSFTSIWAYMEMKKKYRGNNINNLSLTYREVKYKISSATYSRAIKELVKYGFIDIVRPGRLYRNCTIYGLNSRWAITEIGGQPSPVLEDRLYRGFSCSLYKGDHHEKR